LVGPRHEGGAFLQRHHHALTVAARLPDDPVAGGDGRQIGALEAAVYLSGALGGGAFDLQLLSIVADDEAGLFGAQLLCVDIVPQSACVAALVHAGLTQFLVAIYAASLLLAQAALAHRMLDSRDGG